MKRALSMDNDVMLSVQSKKKKTDKTHVAAMLVTKKCKNVDCKLQQPLPLDSFSKHVVSMDGLRDICKTCCAEQEKAYHNTDKGFMMKMLRTARYRTEERNKKGRNLEFNLTYDQLQAKWIAQNGKCAITNMPMQLRQHSHFQCSIERLDNDIGYTIQFVIFVI